MSSGCVGHYPVQHLIISVALALTCPLSALTSLYCPVSAYFISVLRLSGLRCETCFLGDYKYTSAIDSRFPCSLFLFFLASVIAMAHARPLDLREYVLTMRQEPKQARMCGVGGKGPCSFSYSKSVAYILSCYTAADRRPIDPPPIVQLRVIDHASRDREREGSSRGSSPGRFTIYHLWALPYPECGVNLVLSDLTRIVFGSCHISESISLLLFQIECRDLCVGSLIAPRISCPRSFSLLPITRC